MRPAGSEDAWERAATPSDPDRDRAVELLVDRAAMGFLDPDDQRELDALLVERPELDDGSYDRAAAALTLALLGADLQPLPFELRRRLEDA